MIITPLLRLTHAAPSPEVERVVLSYLVFLAQESPVSLWCIYGHMVFSTVSPSRATLRNSTLVFLSDHVTSLRRNEQR